MRRMGERRPNKNPLKGFTIGLFVVFVTSTVAIWHQNKLITAALGKKKPAKEVKTITPDDHPSAEDRESLKTLITHAGGK